LISRAGGSPADLLEVVRREHPHYFKGPDDAAPAMVPTPAPRGLTPDARLAVANGHEPMRPGHAR
jgi:hypothetical protein